MRYGYPAVLGRLVDAVFFQVKMFHCEINGGGGITLALNIRYNFDPTIDDTKLYLGTTFMFTQQEEDAKLYLGKTFLLSHR